MQFEQRNLSRTRRAGHPSDFGDFRNFRSPQHSGRCSGQRVDSNGIIDDSCSNDNNDFVGDDDEQRQEGHEQRRRSKASRTTQRH